MCHGEIFQLTFALLKYMFQISDVNLAWRTLIFQLHMPSLMLPFDSNSDRVNNVSSTQQLRAAFAPHSRVHSLSNLNTITTAFDRNY
jgi:hypothetical protein